MSDPFAFDDPNAPGLGGMPVGFWQNLARFSGNWAAAQNARTSDGHLANGTGPLAGFAQAGAETLDQNRQLAMTRASLAGTQADTQGKQLANAAAGSALPLTVAKNNYMAQFWNDPSRMDALMNDVGNPSSATPAQLPAVSNYAATINNGEGNGKDPRSSAVGGFIDGTWNQFAQENPQYFRGMQPDQIGAARSDPKLRSAATDWLAMKNAAELGKAGVPPTGQSLGLAHFLGPQAAAAVMKAPAGTPVGQVLTQTLGPQQTQAYVQANPALGAYTVDGLKNRYANVPTPAQFQQQGQPQPGGRNGLPSGQLNITGEQALAQAQAYEAQANRIEVAKSMGLPMGGDPATLRAAASQFRQMALAGPTKRAEAQNSNVDMRPGGMALIQGPNGPEWIKNPQLEKTVQQDGTTLYTHVSPPLPGAPPGSAGEATPVVGADGKPSVAALPPQLTEARKKAYEDFTGKDTDAYISAAQTQGWLEQMDKAAQEMNKEGGWLGTGPTADARLKFASVVNDAGRVIGLKEAFNPNTLGSWEELKKATTTAGFELSSHYEGHARQAAQTIINATSAVPGETNSPVGFQTVRAGIWETAQFAKDIHEAKQAAYDANGDLAKAETDFVKQFPPQMYARRAISTVKPIQVTGDSKELTRLLPGTFVQRGNGPVVMVPERPGAPKIPPDLAKYQQQ